MFSREEHSVNVPYLNGLPLRGLLHPQQLVDLGHHLRPEGEGAGEGAAAELAVPRLLADGAVAGEEALQLCLDLRLGGGAVRDVAHHRGLQIHGHGGRRQVSRVSRASSSKLTFQGELSLSVRGTTLNKTFFLSPPCPSCSNCSWLLVQLNGGGAAFLI